MFYPPNDDDDDNNNNNNINNDNVTICPPPDLSHFYHIFPCHLIFSNFLLFIDSS